MATLHLSPRTVSSISLSAWALILSFAVILLLGLTPISISDFDANQQGAAESTSFHPELSRVFSLALEAMGALSKQDVGASTQKTSSAVAASFLDAIKARRTRYALDKNLPISEDEITRIVQEAIQAVPSSFNSQTNRAVVLFGNEHDRLWDIVTEVLSARVSEDQRESMGEKTAGFKAAAGTVLFFVDTAVVQTFATNIPSYADQFPVWAAQSDAMLQHTIWTALGIEGLGGNLQHYNPLIDAKVAEAWSLPATWRLTAQFVFGGLVGLDPEPQEKQPLEGKLRVFGGSGKL